MSAEEFYQKGVDKYILKHDFKGTIADLNPVSYTHLTLPTIYTV